MKKILFFALFLAFSAVLQGQVIDVYFENITNKSATAKWTQTTGSVPIFYYMEFGPKGFERGQGQMRTQGALGSKIDMFGLESDTEYSFFIRGNNTSETDPIWFVEHTFKTFPCNTEISGIESREIWTTCECHNGAVAVCIGWEEMADAYELEYGLKDFQQGTGEIIETGESYVIISYDKLHSYTDYDFYVRAKCNGTFGEWTADSFSTTQLNTGIEDIKITNFGTFPNPVDDVLNINFNSAFDLSSVVVNIFDLTGSLKYKSVYKDDYNVSSLPAGTYILNVRDKTKSEAMIIQKK